MENKIYFMYMGHFYVFLKIFSAAVTKNNTALIIYVSITISLKNNKYPFTISSPESAKRASKLPSQQTLTLRSATLQLYK